MKNELPELIMDTKNSEVATFSEDHLKIFKSAYYCLNAAPDTQIKTFRGSKKIELNDLYTLNQKITEKLDVHKIVVRKVSVSVLLEKNRSFNFESWEEFKLTQWDYGSKTKSINLEWDFFMQHPRYEMPQRHTLKVRMGSLISPKELFQILVDGERDIEVEAALSDVVCKVDFVNAVICQELIHIVEDWYELLVDVDQNKVLAWLQKRSNSAAWFMDFLCLFVGLTGLYNLTKFFLSTCDSFNLSSPEVLLKMYLWACCSFFVSVLAMRIGRFTGAKVAQNLGNVNEGTVFLVTTQDRHIVDKRHNTGICILKDFFMRLVIAVLAGIVMIFLAPILQCVK